ncbi:glycosyltransferase family 4 protein [Peribacillus tepidiphilus]|uniref:glycosyltransferase family 4 protein n=1 Tax=Peribacillus tepidiphilus TaxID=2652445 RepID=UPI0035B54FCB
MNVLFIYIIPSGGMETLNRQRCQALQSRGINCHLLYLQYGTGVQNISNIPTFITNNDHEIKQMIDRGNYDAIIVSSDSTWLKKIRGFGYKGKLIFEVQGLGEETIASGILQNIKGLVSSYADGFLYPRTPHLMRAIEKFYPQIRKYSFHNCIDTNLFTYRPSSQGITSPIVGWVGRIEKNKNWNAFLDIGNLLVRRNPSIQLWIFQDDTLGNANEKVRFHQKVNLLKLKNNLKIFSNIRHDLMAEQYSIIGDSGGFLCSTSITEGFGYAVVEAMACRCPVITTDSDGVKSFIIHNQTGKFFKDINDAVRQAGELMNNPSLRELIRSNGQQHIQTHFSPAIYAQNFLGMLNDLGVS